MTPGSMPDEQCKVNIVPVCRPYKVAGVATVVARSTSISARSFHERFAGIRWTSVRGPGEILAAGVDVLRFLPGDPSIRQALAILFEVP